MTQVVQSGSARGLPFFIETKPDGLVKAIVNRKTESFNTWSAAERWVDHEIIRSSKQ